MAKKNEPNSDKTEKYTEEELSSFVEELEGDTETQSETPATASKRKVVVQDQTIHHTQRRPLIQDAPTPGDLPSALTSSTPKDMGTLVKAKRSFPWGIVIGIVALLAVVSVAGFFVFNRAKKFTNTNVQLQFTSATTATSGSTMTLTVEYQNLEPVDITQAQLALLYPDGFTYSSSTPTASTDLHNTFSLGTIRSGQAGKVIIQGTLLGALQEKATFSATLTYRPSTFNSDFQQKANTEITISSSILQLSITGPTQLAPSANGSWTISYANTSDHDASNVLIQATLPDSFTLTSAKPTADSGTSGWTLASVKQGAKGTIVFNGTVNGVVGDTLPFKVTAGLVGVGGKIEPQDEQSLLVVLVKTGMSVSVAVNGSTDPVTVVPGDALNYSVRVTNSSDLELTNVTLTAKLEGAGIDTTKIANDSNGTVSGTTFTWTKDNLAALGSFKPGQSATLSFGVGTLAKIPMTADGDRDQKVTLTVNLSAPGLANNTNSSAQTATVVSKIATIVGVSTDARLYDDTSVLVGSGTVPPTVGKTTTFRVTWAVTNTTSDASTMVVTGRLPNSVLWTGKNIGRDAGDIVFDPATRIVQWTLNTLPAGTGGRVPKLTAHFDVSITPTADQVGSVPILVETTSFSATDSYSKQPLTATAATVTTDIPNDPKSANQGTVVAS